MDASKDLGADLWVVCLCVTPLMTACEAVVTGLGGWV